MKRSNVVLSVLLSLVALVALAQPSLQTAGRPDIRARLDEPIALQTSVDLVVKDVGLSGLGEIVFTLQNRGDININPGKYTAASKSITTPPIRMDLYFGGTLIQSVYQQSLGGKESHVFTVKPVSNIPKCKDSRTIKVVVDPMNVIKELHDDNNVATVTVARPCPDLAIKSIGRAREGIAGETYRVKVTVINQGNAPAPSSQAWGTALSSAPGITGWPELVPVHTIPALAPGETFDFKIGGSVMSFDNSWVKIFLDRDRLIEESNEENNFLDKKI
jgi:hypothetical protein